MCIFLGQPLIIFVTWMPCLHKLCTHNLSSNKVGSATRNWVLHQKKQPLHELGVKALCWCFCLSFCKQATCRTLQGSAGSPPPHPFICCSSNPRDDPACVQEQRDIYRETRVYFPESCCICCLSDIAVLLLSRALTTPSIIFPCPPSGQQKIWGCLHFSRGCQLCLCSACSVSCRRRWFIWKVPRPGCQWATASCSLGLPAGLSHLKKLTGWCFYPALLPHSFSEHFALFTKAKGLLGSFCHSMCPTACSFVGTESLALFFWRTCCIKNLCPDVILHSEVWLQYICLFTACLYTVKYKCQPINQHQAYTV